MMKVQMVATESDDCIKVPDNPQDDERISRFLTGTPYIICKVEIPKKYSAITPMWLLYDTTHPITGIVVVRQGMWLIKTPYQGVSAISDLTFRECYRPTQVSCAYCGQHIDITREPYIVDADGDVVCNTCQANHQITAD